jgi:hypothetical protein
MMFRIFSGFKWMDIMMITGLILINLLYLIKTESHLKGDGTINHNFSLVLKLL